MMDRNNLNNNIRPSLPAPPPDDSMNSINGTANKKSKEEYQSIIECGHLDKTNVRRMTAFSPFFNKQVEIYTAANDPERRVLYRASALKDKFGAPTNTIGMWMARRRHDTDGVFQATSFEHKPAGSGRTGLQAGGYFVSLAACQKFGALQKGPILSGCVLNYSSQVNHVYYLCRKKQQAGASGRRPAPCWSGPIHVSHVATYSTRRFSYTDTLINIGHGKHNR
jgi:hypothetical protein